ncbi:MAG: hypothetical protein LC750_09015, partial [Actinobacteria bacterium]|nr:hypothetical protein [Actinomycetota bacterium]
LRLPGTPHITLARGKVSLDRYVPFLVEGSAEARDGAAKPRARVEAVRHTTGLPATGLPQPLAIPGVLLALAALGVILLLRRRTP